MSYFSRLDAANKERILAARRRARQHSSRAERGSIPLGYLHDLSLHVRFMRGYARIVDARTNNH